MTAIAQLANLFIGASFWSHLIDFLNINCPNEVKEFSGVDMQNLAWLLCWLSFYNVSIDTVLKHPYKHETVVHQIAFMGGEDRAKCMLQSLDMNQPKKNYGTSSDFPCNSVAVIKEFQTRISESCSSLACQKGTDLTTDDDKMRNRSTKVKKVWLGRSKGLKSHGPANDAIGATRTRLFCACHMSLFGKSVLDSFKHMLLSISRVKLLDKVNLQETTMHSDQGFNDGECFDFCDKHDIDSVNTVKRGHPCLLFLVTPSAKQRKNKKRSQKMV